jgi:hypothetical protein
MRSLQQLLECTVSNVFGNQANVCRRSLNVFKFSDSVGAVLKKLATANILSAVVLVKDAESETVSEREDDTRASIFIRQILGFIDLSIILQAALRRTCPADLLHESDLSDSASCWITARRPQNSISKCPILARVVLFKVRVCARTACSVLHGPFRAMCR